MKETIYTIPLTEALDENCECAFCFLADKLEKEQVEYALGAAMMEPDYRILSNAKGFCRRHVEKMARAKKALPLALVLDTRTDEVIKTLETVRPKEEKGGLFKKDSGVEKLIETVCEMAKTCLVCERIDATCQKFYHTFWYMYQKEPDFIKRVLEGKGFCLHHFSELLQATDKLSGGKRDAFIRELFALEMDVLKRTKEDVHGFTKQFDYRADKENWQGPKDAHLLCAARLSGSFERD